MKKVTIINGKQGSGKTILAMQIANKKNAIWMSGLNYSYLKSELSEQTEIIILDELHDTKKTATELQILLRNQNITFRKPYASETTTIPLPDFIITTQDLSLIPTELKRSSKIINL